jgi:hypothetical protein
MEQKERAVLFGELHVKGDPLILFNIWDAGGAKSVQEAGAKAIATGSWSVAAANGFSDGQNLSFGLALENLKRITGSVDLPVTIDLEGGYAEDLAGLRENVGKVIAAGAIGINFEDQIVGGEGLYSIEAQAKRIGAIREAAELAGVPLFQCPHGRIPEKSAGRGYRRVSRRSSRARQSLCRGRSRRIFCSRHARSEIDRKDVRAFAAAGKYHGDVGYAFVPADGGIGSGAYQLWPGPV